VELHCIPYQKPSGSKPLAVNSYVIFWLAIELIFRFFMQSLPVMNIKPLLVLPIKKESVIHFVDEECHFYLQYFPLDDYPFWDFQYRKLWDIKHYLDAWYVSFALIVNC
jgi:hypothetical protein